MSRAGGTILKRGANSVFISAMSGDAALTTEADASAASAGSEGVLWSPRVRPLWILGLLLLVMFAGFRIGLLVASREALRTASSGEIARCLLTGLRMDLRVTAAVLAPLLLALAFVPGRIVSRRRFRRIVTVYAAAAFTAATSVEVIGAAFFMHFGSRLNWIAIDHFGHFGELWAHIWNTYPMVLFAAGIVTCLVAGGWAMSRALWGAARAWSRPATRRPAASGVALVAAASVAWGAIGVRPMRRDVAYFTGNNVLVQLSMNNLHTLAAAVRSRANDGLIETEMYDFPRARRARKVAAGMLNSPADRLVRMPGNALWRRTITSRPPRDWNVVVIIMEGMSGEPVGALGHSPSHTPNLDALCEKGLFFSRAYAVGSRTNRGLAAVLCGHPDLSGQPVLKRPRAQGNFLTLPEMLRRRGYRTLFVVGGDPDFDNMEGFFTAAGVEEFVIADDVDWDSDMTNWGVPDEAIFDKAHETFLSQGDRPFFSVVLTVSCHPPYEVPDGRVEMLPVDGGLDELEVETNRRLNAYRYADWALGEYFRKAREAAYFNRTLFVLVADHGHALDRRRLVDVPGYRVPLLFYAPRMIGPRRVGRVASQTDIPPTVLALLGGEFEHCFLGRSLLSAGNRPGFALLHQDDRLAMVTGDTALVLPPWGRPARVFHTTGPDLTPLEAPADDPAFVARLQEQMLSYYLMAWRLYWKGVYRPMTGGR